MNIINVGAEHKFYDREGDSRVDELQTEREGEFAPLIQSMRDNAVVQAGSEDLIAEFVVNLVIRTRHMRDMFLSWVRNTSSALRQSARAPEQIRKIVNYVYAREFLDGVARRLGHSKFEDIPSNIREPLFAPFADLLDDDSWLIPATPALQAMADSIWDKMDAAINYGAVKNAHLSALEQSIAPAARV